MIGLVVSFAAQEIPFLLRTQVNNSDGMIVSLLTVLRPPATGRVRFAIFGLRSWKEVVDVISGTQNC